MLSISVMECLMNNVFKTSIPLVLLFMLSSCGTTRGIFVATSSVLEGAAEDVRSVGDWF